MSAAGSRDAGSQYDARAGNLLGMDRGLIRSTAALYDALASEYVERVGTELSPEFETTFDREILARTAEVLLRRNGVVLDLGCGPGRVAACLSGSGINVVGLDISKTMIGAARVAHPSIQFACASLSELPVRSGCLVGVVSWYSIIHTSPDDLREVFAEIARSCQDDAEVLFAFQTGDGDRVERADAYATGRTMTSYRHSVDHVAEALGGTGFRVSRKVVREPDRDHESTPQGFVVARSLQPR